MRKVLSIVAIVFLLVMSPLLAQDLGVSQQLGYPELIVYNAKLVTMDDGSNQSTVGTIAQAMAIRGHRILKVGTSAAVRALAGPQTKQLDMKGKTVLPSFIMTHEHPTDWMFIDPEAVRHALPEDNDILVAYSMPPIPAKEQFAQFEAKLNEAVAKAKPGQWILFAFNWGPNYEYAREVSDLYNTEIKKERLDRLAPNNPVKVKDGFIGGVLNTRGIEETKKVFPDMTSMTRGRSVVGTMTQMELEGNGDSRPIEPDVIFRGRTPELANVLKAELELWAAHGMTTFASSPYSFHNFQAMNYLDREGQMPSRFGWGYTGPDFDVDTLRWIVGMLGRGSDYLWNVGIWSSSGGNCTTIDAAPAVKAKERCNFEPGSLGRAVLERIIREGGRIATMHTGGDKDIDYYMDAIQKASAEAGFTLDQIRAKRFAFDHGSGAPRPDQIPRVKNLGMYVSMINTMLWENHREYDTSVKVRNYGIEFAHYSVPRKSVTDANIKNGFEIDRPLPHLLFTMINKGMTRYNDQEKRVLGAREATDRIVQLKALTTWGSWYVLREKDLGSLAEGKLADFIVLDRDYLTVPEAEIPKLKVLMTVVGGDIRHLVPSLARDIGLAPAGPVTWPTRPFANYYKESPLASLVE